MDPKLPRRLDKYLADARVGSRKAIEAMWFAGRVTVNRDPTHPLYRLVDPEHVYLLQGYFGEIERGGGAQSTYYFEMTLTHLASSRIVFVEQFDQKQLR